MITMLNAMRQVNPVHPSKLQPGKWFPASPQRARAIVTHACHDPVTRLPRPGRELVIATHPTVVITNDAGRYEVRCY